MKMTKFWTHSLNNIHYVTTVTYDRIPIFKNDYACEIFISVLDDLRQIHKLKVIGYVIMPDHVHLLLNPLDVKIGVIMRKLKGKTGKLIVEWLKEHGRPASLEMLSIRDKTKRQNYAVWQRDFSSIDIVSPKFFGQKLIYIHKNPVAAGLCSEPGDWKFSSYNAYFPHEPGSVPLEIDLRPLWNRLEIEDFEMTQKNEK
jgi:putative transposase